MSQPEHPVVAALAVVIEADAALLVCRGNPPDAGYWGFPGGKVELGETVQQAAARELREETGVRARALEAFTAVDALDRDDTGALRHHHVLVAVRCRYLGGRPRAASDARAARWVPLAELDGAALTLSARVAEVAREAGRLASAPSARRA